MRGSHFWLAAATVLVAVAGFSTPNEAEDRGCSSATSEEVRALYAGYADLLRQGDVEALTSLYSPDAILMGPGAASVRLGRAEIAGYYSSFLQRRPSVVPLERVVRTDCGLLGATGAEALSLSMDGRQTRSFTTRFSLSYARFGERWLIVHHHQELQDGPPSLDLKPESASAARVVTGANPPASTPSITLPPPALQLPASGPVILTGQRPLVTEPVVAIDHAALDQLMDLARQMIAKRDITIPRMAYSLGLSAPTVEMPSTAGADAEVVPSVPMLAAKLPVPQLAATKLPPIVIAVPAAQFTLPSPPPAIDVLRLAGEAAVLPSAPSKQREISAAKPAVAGFAQRAPASPVPASPVSTSPEPRTAALPKPPRHDLPTKVKVEPRAKPEPPTKPAALVKALPKPAAKEPPVKTGRFLRWEDGVPIFDE